MAPRAFWKGSLKLSLVPCPIALLSCHDRSGEDALPYLTFSESRCEPGNSLQTIRHPRYFR